MNTNRLQKQPISQKLVFTDYRHTAEPHIDRLNRDLDFISADQTNMAGHQEDHPLCRPLSP